MSKILWTLGLVLIVFLMIPIFLGSQFQIERSVTIHRSVDDTFSFLEDFSNFKLWNPFLAAEPDTKVTINGVGQGSTYEWDGEKTGKGKMSLKRLEANEKIYIDMEFFAPMEGIAQVEWSTEPEGEMTKVTWTMRQEFSYMKRYFKLLMQGMMEKTFDDGLAKLKSHLEKQ